VIKMAKDEFNFEIDDETGDMIDKLLSKILKV